MISVIIPFYNTERYLEECLSSIKAQTFSDFECLMVDDGSTDNSRIIAKKFTADPRFKLLGSKHIGFPNSKNLGLDNASGDYICFVDSDDYVLPQYLEILYTNLINTDSDICSCNYTRFKDTNTPLIMEKGAKIRTYQNDSKVIHILYSTFMWDKIYKKELFDNLRFDDVIALSDTMLSYKLFERAKQTTFIDKILLCHRDHNENMTYHVRNFEPTYWEHRLNVYLTMCTYLLEHHPKLELLIKHTFKAQMDFIKPHINMELYNSYLKQEAVKTLLN